MGKTVLFTGDSISDGNRYKEEKDRSDLNHQIGHSYVYVMPSTPRKSLMRLLSCGS